jgi:flagellin FlaB
MKIMKHEEAFTGLEAAIVLIAFVVVAAVFSYVMLGAGFFTTQKSQEVVHTGVDQASSSVELIGTVFGYNNTDQTPQQIDFVTFTLGSTAGGTGVDMEKILLTYRDNATSKTIAKVTNFATAPTTAATEGTWNISKRQNADTDLLLETGEQFTIVVGVPVTTAKAVANNEFTIEVKPSAGAVLPIFRTVPAQIDAVNKLY